MRSETFTLEHPRSLRKSRQEHRLGGSEAGWSLRSLKATASTPSGDVVLSAVGPLDRAAPDSWGSLSSGSFLASAPLGARLRCPALSGTPS